MSSLNVGSPERRKARDFWKFWTGETISNLGSSFTQFALPLLVFKLTGSALNLGIATAATTAPYLLFGLLIGAWADRVDRKRMMILADLGQAVVLASVPVLFLMGALSIWWIYGVAFASGLIKVFFDAGQFAAIPSLVEKDDLGTANGRIQASFYGASLVGPLLAGALLFILPVPALLFVDAGSFLVSAVMLSLVKNSFNLGAKREKKSLWHDVVEGLRYLFSHPVLRAIAIILIPGNFFMTITLSQLVLFAERQLHATDTNYALLNAAGSAGVVVCALLVGQFRKRWSFTRLLLPTLAFCGLSIIALSLSTSIWMALPIWGLVLGGEQFFGICTASLRQTIVPNHMLGRVQTMTGVVCYSAIPLGSLTGGAVIKATSNIMLVYLSVGVGICLVAVVSVFTALGHADRYLPKQQEQPQSEVGVVAEKGA